MFTGILNGVLGAVNTISTIGGIINTLDNDSKSTNVVMDEDTYMNCSNKPPKIKVNINTVNINIFNNNSNHAFEIIE